jgi:hypothetical protein
MRKPKWKGVVMCMSHGVRLCTGIMPPSLPELYQVYGEKVIDYSWTCPTKTSCWNKFHDYYLPKKLFSKKEINLSENTIKFGYFIYSSELYQKKYKALGIEVNQHDEGLKKNVWEESTSPLIRVNE